LAGFIGREAWKSADMANLGFMAEVAQGSAQWWQPTLLGAAPEFPALLPFWLGAWAIQLTPAGWPTDYFARIPFGLLAGLAMAATWYATYYLARSPRAQPVAFAFGGEARPADYARAIADGGLMAYIACLGLAQLSHETTPALAQLGCTALLFFGLAVLPYRRTAAAGATALGLLGLALSGAPMLALLYGLGGAAVHWLDRAPDAAGTATPRRCAVEALLILAAATAVSAVAAWADLWRWKIALPHATWAAWNGIAQLLLWFTWPTWPLVLWSAWRWRRQLFSRQISRHLALPAWFVGVTVVATLLTGATDRTLLLALPPMATLAAFALPTLQRQVSALIDWFTLLFFSTCGFIIWVIWSAMQTGFPAQPAANVARLAPDFVAHFSVLEFSLAVLATLAWAWLVKWRVGRHRAALWKSLVLPSAGAALCVLLLTTLWLPLLNHAQSYTTLVQRTMMHIGKADCVEVTALSQGQIAAFQFYGRLPLRRAGTVPQCQWLLAEPGPDMAIPDAVDISQWTLYASALHRVEGGESVLILRRK
ncbi:MAG: hypothetical protein ACR2I0_03570, partial [Rhodoferax sp.]